MSEEFGSVEDTLEPGTHEDVQANLEIDESIEKYLNKGKENYLGHEESGIDRFNNKVAEILEDYNPEFNNSYVQGLADNTTDFGKGVVQGVAGSLSAPGAVYDGIKEMRNEDYKNSISFYDQIERHNEDKTASRYLGEAAGFTAGAALGVQNPELFLAEAAHNARHLGERKAHEKLRDNFYDEEQTAS